MLSAENAGEFTGTDHAVAAVCTGAPLSDQAGRVEHGQSCQVLKHGVVAADPGMGQAEVVVLADEAARGGSVGDWRVRLLMDAHLRNNRLPTFERLMK